MTYLKAIVLAIVEGVTEFLPISSTGHLIILDEYLVLSPDARFADAFMVVIQLPAILAVVVYFWNELWPFGADLEARNAKLVLWTKIATAFIPAAVLGALLGELIQQWLFNAVVVAAALATGGIVLIALEHGERDGTIASVHAITFRAAFCIGVVQCFAMIPGTSRSAATIIGAMLFGATRVAAAEFSFFLAIPTMMGATGYTLMKRGLSFDGEQWLVLGLGSLVSFAVAYAVIADFMSFIRRRNFKPFGYYRIALGLAVLAYFAFVR